MFFLLFACAQTDVDVTDATELVEGPSLGGIDAGWLRTAADGRVVCLRFSRFSAEGRPDVDRAVTAWKIGMPWSDLGLLPHLLEEAVLGRDDEAAALAREVFQRLARPEPDAVEVVVSGGPDWLDTTPWSGRRTPAEARRILPAAVSSVGLAAVPPSAAVPDTAVPDAPLPGVGVPDATIPDATIPDATIPDAPLGGLRVPGGSVPAPARVPGRPGVPPRRLLGGVDGQRLVQRVLATQAVVLGRLGREVAAGDKERK